MRHLPLRAAIVFIVPTLAQAHPGHDDHEFAWNWAHLTSAPVATIGCLLFLLGCAGMVWSMVRAASAKAATIKARGQGQPKP
jgi:hypothetical protein